MKVPFKSRTPIHSHRTVFIVLPAYNEGPTLARLFGRIDEVMTDAGLPYRVVIVDDGSTDDTLAIANGFSEKMPLVVKHHTVNQGLGATIRDGLVEATRLASDNDIIITMDADDTHSPGLVLRMVEMVREGFDVVIASRFQKNARVIGVPLLRRLLSRCASTLFRCVLPIKGVKDFTCGYRAYRAETIKKAMSRYGETFITRDGFECMVDILLKMRNMGLIFGEVPIVLRYDHKEGRTKMNLSATIGNSLRLLVKRRLGR
jgi:dolichol-phosphate mannosyltransferase